MTKQEIVTAIRVCAKKLHRNPSLRELRSMSGVPAKAVYKRLGGLNKALQAAGLEGIGPGFSPAEETVLRDWATVARKLKKLPSILEYERAGRFSGKPFHRLYGSWSATPEGFRNFAGKRGLHVQWGDVLEMIKDAPAKSRGAAIVPASGARGADDGGKRRFRKGGILRDRPVYGRPLPWPELAHEPVNELGVVFVFGMMARRLGFVVHRLQAGFPDCIAMREVAPGMWQRVRIEFEFESRNFRKHKHRSDKCDVIVCWKHNWKDCPLDVVELGRGMENLTTD
jgi:Homing endonuclease associated repeat